MRLNMTQQGGLSDEFVSGGGRVLNPLILIHNPIGSLEAATKQYVDNSLLALNVNNLISGTISSNRFPAMNGDLVSSSGSGNFVLSATGVASGVYAKVSVNNKGRITNGLPLIESDIPNISWDKISTDKPTSLAGYGITDAVHVTGGTMIGAISVSGSVSVSNQLANKTYLDSVVGGTTGIAVGDIISKIDPTTPTGFLKCNGSDLLKADYTDLYGVIGDRFTVSGKAGNGQPWRNQFDINKETFTELSNVELSNSRSIASMPGILGGACSFVTKNRVYVFGGYNGASYVGTGYTAAINNDGTLGNWTATAALPAAYAFAQAIVVRNKVHILGGSPNGSAGSTATYVADINADGTIGTWGNGASLPVAVGYVGAFINQNRLYSIGGYNGATLNYVFSAKIKEDGSTGPWVTEANLPFITYSCAPVCIKNRVYIFGAHINGAYSSSVYSASLNLDGTLGTWSNDGNIPVTMSLQSTLAVNNTVYLIGGVQTGVTSSSIYKADINPDGTIGGWKLHVWSLPNTCYDSNIAVVKNKAYMFGGMINAVWSNVCFSMDISGGLNDYSPYYSVDSNPTNYLLAGSGRPWEQQYQINSQVNSNISGWVTDTALPNLISTAQAVVTKDYAYLLGGFIAGYGAISNVYQAPINTDGTLGTWASIGVLPSVLCYSKAAVIKNKVYLFGGSTDGNNSISVVYTANINSDGTLTTFTSAVSLPGAMSNTHLIVTNSKVYLAGGNNSNSYLSTVYVAEINVDGTLGGWASAPSLPEGFYCGSVILTKNRVYIIGGRNAATVFSKVYTATINSDGSVGLWVLASTSLPDGMQVSSCFATNDRVYMFGGTNASSVPTATVYTAPINSDGILGSWTTGTALPGALSQSSLIATKNRLYLLGGYNSSTVYTVSISGGSNDYSSYYAEDTTNYIMPGSGKPWCQQYQINTTQSADVTNWSTDVSLPNVLILSQAIVTKNRVYLLGGHNGTSGLATVYTATVNSDGTLGAWTTDASLPGATTSSAVVVTKNRVYLLGGSNGTSGLATVYTAAISADGTLGGWTTDTSLPGILVYSSVVVTKNRVYLLGGTNGGSYVNTVYSAPINITGVLGTWTTDTPLPSTLAYSSVVVTKNRVYLLGGHNGTSFVSTIYTASINASGILGDWITTTSLPQPLGYASVFITNNKVYLIGGRHNSGFFSTVYMSSINTDGTLGTWTTGTSLPGLLLQSQVVITSNFIYLLGGSNGSNGLSTVYKASITGSLNDYSPYYNGDILPIEQFVTTAKFKLPDASFSNDNLNYFIKY